MTADIVPCRWSQVEEAPSQTAAMALSEVVLGVFCSSCLFCCLLFWVHMIGFGWSLRLFLTVSSASLVPTGFSRWGLCVWLPTSHYVEGFVEMPASPITRFCLYKEVLGLRCFWQGTVIAHRSVE